MTSQPMRKACRLRIAGFASAIAAVFVVEPAAIAQEILVVPPSRKSVRIDNDPLKQRSATQNIVFGQIVDVDEHRLNLQESGPDEDARTTLRVTPESQVTIEVRPRPIRELPKDARPQSAARGEDPASLVERVRELEERQVQQQRQIESINRSLRQDITGARPSRRQSQATEDSDPGPPVSEPREPAPRRSSPPAPRANQNPGRPAPETPAPRP